MKKAKKFGNLSLAALFAVPGTAIVSAEGWAQLDEIVVTTRKREENLQNVPISVEAFGSEQISNFGIDDAQDLAKFSAGIQFDEGFGGQDTRIVIRGLSPTRGRPNAAFLVDGIDFTGEAVSTAGGGFLVNNRLLDVERIEVVKGPQSALYGRSAFAGAVQYVTKSPNMDEFEGSASVDIATDEQYEVSGSVSGPVTDNFGLLLNALYYDEEGFHENTLTGDTVGGAEGWGISGTALWEATDSLDFKLRLAYSEDEYEPNAQARVNTGTVQQELPEDLLRGSGLFGSLLDASDYPACDGLPSGGDFRVGSCFSAPKLLVAGTMPDGDDLEVGLSPDPETGEDYAGSDVETFNATLVGTWDLDSGTFTSLTGFARVESQQNFDSDWDYLLAGDYTSTDGLFSFTLPECGFVDCSPTAQEIDFANETQLFSQELRYATNFDGPVNFTVGGLYWNESVDQDENSATATVAVFRGFTDLSSEPSGASILPDIVRSTREVSRDTEHWSVYGLVEWEINEQFKASFEARYVEEEIEVIGAVCDEELTQANTGLSCGDFTSPSSPVENNGVFYQANTSGVPVTSKESFVAPKLTLEYTPNDDMTFYASVAEGVKPGGISTITAGAFFNPDANTYDAEKLRAYELGAKTTWLDNTLRLNGGVFFQEYTDKQVGITQNIDGVDVGTIANAGEAEIWGIELEALWQATDNLTFQGSYTWLDAEYTEWFEETTSTTAIARNIYSGNGGCLEVIDTTLDGSSDAKCVISYAGNTIEDIPEHAFVGNVEYRAPLNNTDLDWFVGGTTVFTSERYIDETNIKKLDSYWTSDLRAGLAAENWDLLFYVENVFDDDTVKSAVDVGSQVTTTREGMFPPGPQDGVIVSLPDPRIFGVRAQVRF